MNNERMHYLAARLTALGTALLQLVARRARYLRHCSSDNSCRISCMYQVWSHLSIALHCCFHGHECHERGQRTQHYNVQNYMLGAEVTATLVSTPDRCCCCCCGLGQACLALSRRLIRFHQVYQVNAHTHTTTRQSGCTARVKNPGSVMCPRPAHCCRNPRRVYPDT
jgi:hypothetical protein